jgi:hypothetical protein
LLDPAIVGLLDRSDVAVDAHLLANARKIPESTDDVATNRGDVLILPLQARQLAHLVNSEATVDQELVIAESLRLPAPRPNSSGS